MSSYSIQELMTCKYEGCNKIFKNPIELECNNTICKEHIEKILNESETKNMNCKLCNKNHTILIYHANTTMEKLLKMNAHLNNEQKLFHNEFKTCIKEMDIAYIKVKSLLDKPRDYLINQINLIKTNIELQNNKFINYSNKISTEYLRILDSFQKECEVKLKERVCVHTVEKDICYEDYEEAYEDSIRIKFDKEIMKETIDRIKKSTENYNEQFKRLTMLVFMNKKIKFEPKKIDNDLFGKLEIKIDKVKEETYVTNCKVESELEDIYDSCESSLSHSIENKNESLSTDSESKITTFKRKSSKTLDQLNANKKTRSKANNTVTGNGKGTKLGEISYIRKAFESREYIKNKKYINILYHICISINECKDINLIIDRLNNFNGFPFEFGSFSYERKSDLIKQNTENDLKNLAKILRLNNICNKENLVDNILKFLLCPKEINTNSKKETFKKCDEFVIEKNIAIEPDIITKSEGQIIELD